LVFLRLLFCRLCGNDFWDEVGSNLGPKSGPGGEPERVLKIAFEHVCGKFAMVTPFQDPGSRARLSTSLPGTTVDSYGRCQNLSSKTPAEKFAVATPFQTLKHRLPRTSHHTHSPRNQKAIGEIYEHCLHAHRRPYRLVARTSCANSCQAWGHTGR